MPSLFKNASLSAIGVALLTLMASPDVSAQSVDAAEIKSRLAALTKSFQYLDGDLVCEGILEELQLSGRRSSKRFVYKQRGDSVCLEYHFLDSSGAETGTAWVICRNPEQSFWLSRKRAEAPFVVRSLTRPGDENHEQSSQFKMRLDAFARLVRNTAFGAPLGNIARFASQDAFEVTSADFIPADGGNLREVTYRFESEADTHEGTLWLDPRFAWAVVKHDLRQSKLNRPAIHSVSEATFTTNNGRHYPKTYHLTLAEDEEVLASWSLEFTRFDETTVPDDAFLLTAYGVPPVAIDAPARRGLLSKAGWPLFAAFVIAAAAFLVARTLRLRSTS